MTTTKEAVRDPLDRQRRRAEQRVAKALYTFWAGQRERLEGLLATQRGDLLAAQAEQTSGLTAKAAPFAITLDWAGEEGQLRADMGELLAEVLVEATDSVAEHYKELGIKLSWEVFDRTAVGLAQKYRYDLIKDITDATRKQLGKTISRWIAGDQEFDDLVAQVRRLVPSKPYPGLRDRAQLIAETEVTRIYGDSRVAGRRAVGLRCSRWRMAQDELVCVKICRPLGQADGGKGALGHDGKYTNPTDGEQYEIPGHPGCRCWDVEDPDELFELVRASQLSQGEAT